LTLQQPFPLGKLLPMLLDTISGSRYFCLILSFFFGEDGGSGGGAGGGTFGGGVASASK